jgi:hypothetical protein
MVCNFLVSAISIRILQTAAREAREQSVASLQEKLSQLKASAAVTVAQEKQKSIEEAEQLLQEIRGLNTGAFAGFWANPILGAFLIPSGGAALIHLLSKL